MIRSLLQANCNRLLELYTHNFEAVLDLQAILLHDILPDIAAELDLDTFALDWAKEWLQDTPSLFQIYRRQKFTKSFAIEAVRKTLLWRLQNVYPNISEQPPRMLHCLPISSRDAYGRPILVVRASSLDGSSEDIKRILLSTIERLRAYLRDINDDDTRPVLQFVLLLDLKGASMQSLNIDVISWAVREVIPRFPGMLAAVFMINYSWAHAGMWAVVKRLLPASAISRVFFPSQQELLEYFSEPLLPKDYGGSLPPLKDLPDPLRVNGPLVPDSLSERSESPVPITDILPAPPSTSPTLFSMSSTSFLNPFFGYPVSSSHAPYSTVPTLAHGRRRKRDLVRTLALLWWIRYKTYVRIGIWFLVAVTSYRLWTRRIARAPGGFLMWLASSTGLGF